MTITRSDLTFLVDETVSMAAFGKFYLQPFMMPLLYRVLPSNQEREVHGSIGELGVWSAKVENVAAAENVINQQFSKQFVHQAYATQLPVSRELIADSKFQLITRLGDQFGQSARQTMETHAAAVFNDAFTGATYLAEDGLSICNAAHLNAQGGNSQTNSGTQTLGDSGLSTGRAAHRALTSYEGHILGIVPDILLVPNELEATAWGLANSQASLASNALYDNFHKSTNLQVVVWDFLTDANAWFTISSQLAAENLLWFQREPLEFFGDGDLFRGTRKLGGYMRYSFGAVDWRFVYGQNPS